MSKEFAKDVKVTPETLSMKPNEGTTVTVENTGKRTLTYKPKTTGPMAVKPNKAFGVVKAGESDAFKVTFKPTAGEKPFSESDRVTVLVNVTPDSFAKPEDYWKTPNAVPDAHRVALNPEGGEAGKPKEGEKKDEKKEKEKDVKSEESEAETESGTESGIEATESGAG